MKTISIVGGDGFARECYTHLNKIAPLSAVYKGCKSNSYLSGNPALKIGEVKNFD